MRRFALVACLMASLAGCKKDTPAAAPKVDVYNTSSTGAGGAAQAVRGAVVRTVKSADLDQMKLYIETLASESERFPNGNAVKTALMADRQMGSIAKLVADGSIVIAPLKQREGIWAYEKLALTEGGIVLSNTGVGRMEASELQAALDK